jgi:cyclophilin family peptidyl-prolyl cis-trans isomerase
MSQEKADTGSSNKKNPLNPTIFLDFDIDRKPAGRIVFELFKDVCPQTVENFRGLCTGEYGTGKSGRPLCLRHSVVYRVSEGSFESGDIVNGTGTGGEVRLLTLPW